MSLSRQGTSIRWVSAIITYFLCVNEIPADQKLLRAYGLRHLYRHMNYKVYWSKGTLCHQHAIDIANDIRKKSIAEFLKNPYIPLFEKVALTTFNYIRFTYPIYLKIAGFLVSLKTSLSKG